MSKSKNKKKNSQMILRVEKHEKEQFLDICKEMDTSAARELRRFMREFVAANQQTPKVEADVAPPAGADEVPAPVADEPIVTETAEIDAAGSAEEDAKPKKKSKKN